MVDDVWMVTELQARNYLRGLLGQAPIEAEPGKTYDVVKLSTLAKRSDQHLRTLRREIEQAHGPLGARSGLKSPKHRTAETLELAG